MPEIRFCKILMLMRSRRPWKHPNGRHMRILPGTAHRSLGLRMEEFIAHVLRPMSFVCVLSSPKVPRPRRVQIPNCQRLRSQRPYLLRLLGLASMILGIWTLWVQRPPSYNMGPPVRPRYLSTKLFSNHWKNTYTFWA